MSLLFTYKNASLRFVLSLWSFIYVSKKDNSYNFADSISTIAGFYLWSFKVWFDLRGTFYRYLFRENNNYVVIVCLIVLLQSKCVCSIFILYLVYYLKSNLLCTKLVFCINSADIICDALIINTNHFLMG